MTHEKGYGPFSLNVLNEKAPYAFFRHAASHAPSGMKCSEILSEVTRKEVRRECEHITVHAETAQPARKKASGLLSVLCELCVQPSFFSQAQEACRSRPPANVLQKVSMALNWTMRPS